MIMQGHVFISYSRKDKKDARRLRDDLEGSGIPVWIDEDDIHPGIDFETEIDRGITNASAILVLLTPISVLSQPVKSEYSYGLNRLIPVVPLIFQHCEMPRMLQTFQTISFVDQYDVGLAALRRCLWTLPQRHLEHLQEIRSALLAAQEESPEPERFQDKIDTVTEMIGGWNDRIERHENRVNSGLEKERQQMAAESRLRRSLSVERIVGPRLQDVSEFFKNRVSTLESIGRQLEKRVTKIISITGRAGIGKSALASKLLADLEHNKWPNTSEGPEVDGIAYLSTGIGAGVSLEQIFLKCARMIGDPSVEAIWKSTSANLDEKISYLLSKADEGIYIILLDNIDKLMDESSHLVEAQLCRFLELAQSQQHSLRLIITSREQIRFQGVGHCDLHHYFAVRLNDGLPNEEAVEFLREMDPQGELGLAEAKNAILTEIVAMTHGVPRALQLFASILANDPFLNLQQLRKTFFDSEDVVKELVEENYLRLDNNARLVLLTLAVFKRAVTTVAVDFMLQEFVPGLDVPTNLRRLTRAQTVTIDRVTNQIALNEVDREWIYSLYRNRAIEGAFPGLTALNRRAAEYYRQQHHLREEWHSIEDVRPQLYQIEHLIDAGDYGEALAVTDEIDPALEMWGYYEHVVELREALNGHLADSELMGNLTRLGRLYALLGQIDKARGHFEEALAIARRSVNRRAESYILGRLGSCAYDLGELQESRSKYEEALSVAREVDDPLCEGMNLYGLGRCHRGGFELALAISRFEEALKKLGEIGNSPHNIWREGIRSQYLIAQSLNNLGLCYRVLCDVAQARQNYERAIEVMNQINDRGGKAYVMTNTASLERLLGNLAGALSLCHQALDIYFDIKDRWGEGSVLRNIGSLYSDLGDSEKASDYHQKALANNQTVNNRKGTAITLLNISLNCLRAERKQEAIDYARRSFDLFRAIGAVRYESHAATQLSWSLLIDGQFSEARETAEKAYKYQIGETEYCALAALGTVALRQYRMEDAEESFMTVLEGTEKQLILTDRLYQARYLRAYAQTGLMLACGTPISEAIQTYVQARENCSSPGILAEHRLRLAAFGEHVTKLAPIQAILSTTVQ